MEEQFVPGEYTVTNDDGLLIRSAMKTYSNSNIVGKYSNGENLTVYQVYPETNGIVWGRVSSSTSVGVARYVGLRVNNRPKVQLEKKFKEEPTTQQPAQVPTPKPVWVAAIDAWARSKGFDGPHPY